MTHKVYNFTQANSVFFFFFFFCFFLFFFFCFFFVVVVVFSFDNFGPNLFLKMSEM